MGEGMVERVARAIALADDEDYMEDCVRFDARARAAIQAMREPDAVMLLAGEAAFKSHCFRYIQGAIPTWEAMIDAALSEPS